MTKTTRKTTDAEIQQTFDDAGFGRVPIDDIELTIGKMEDFVNFTIWRKDADAKDFDRVEYQADNRVVKAVEFSTPFEFSEFQLDRGRPTVVVVDFGDMRAVYYRDKAMRVRATRHWRTPRRIPKGAGK